MATYKIYAIEKYSKANKIYIENGSDIFELIEIIDVLTEYDHGYHHRIDKLGTYKLFGDIDHYKKSIDDFIDIFIEFMKKSYDIDIIK